MKIFFSLFTNIIGLLIVYLAFVKDFKFFEYILYILYVGAFIGLFSETTYNQIEKYPWHVMNIPFTVSAWYIGLNYGGELYATLSILLNFVIYAILAGRKIVNKTEL